MRAETITCDGCGTVKKETNHWFKLVVYEDGKILLGPTSVSLNVITTKYPDNAQPLLDLCGEACVLKKISENLTPK